MKKFKFNIGDIVVHKTDENNKYVVTKYAVIAKGLLESEQLPKGEEVYVISGVRVDNSITKQFVSKDEISKYNG